MNGRHLQGGTRGWGGRAVAVLLACAFSAAVQAADTVTRNGLQWSLATNGEDLPWPEAQQYCADLERDGHADWRLPTLRELETVHDPDAADGSGVAAPIALDTCCLWSDTTLIDEPADDATDTAGPLEDYRWGFLFDSGIRYYSYGGLSDGRALCVRDAR